MKCYKFATNHKDPDFKCIDNARYTEIILLRCIHHFKSHSIINMDHMRISDTEFLVKRSSFKKLKSDAKKFRNKLKPKGME